jgi:hypothetical protein
MFTRNKDDFLFPGRFLATICVARNIAGTFALPQLQLRWLSTAKLKRKDDPLLKQSPDWKRNTIRKIDAKI